MLYIFVFLYCTTVCIASHLFYVIYLFVCLSGTIFCSTFSKQAHCLLFLFACRYITYSKEEEAIRCIQSVHGFVLDGRSLKYVHLYIFSFVH